MFIEPIYSKKFFAPAERKPLGRIHLVHCAPMERPTAVDRKVYRYLAPLEPGTFVAVSHSPTNEPSGAKIKTAEKKRASLPSHRAEAAR